MLKFISGLIIGVAAMYGLVLVTDLGMFRSPYRVPLELFKQRWECSISDSEAFWWATKANRESVIVELHYPFRREKYEILQSEFPKQIDPETLPRKLSPSDFGDGSP